MTSIQPGFDYFLNNLSPDQLSLLDIATSRQFNDELVGLGLSEIACDYLFYELTAYVFPSLDLALRFLDKVLSTYPIDGYTLEPSDVNSIFDEHLINMKRLPLTLPKWALGATETFALYQDGRELLYLEQAAVTGRVRLLWVEDKVVLLTLAGFD